MIGNQEDNGRTVVLSTKVPAAVAERLNTICDVMHVDVYHLLQWFVYVIDRASAEHFNLDPELQKIMSLLESDAGWQSAFNLANPDKLRVAQAILILEQEHHKGFGAVMIDKPWMGAARQTECVDEILERVTEVTMAGIYKKLRRVGSRMHCTDLRDILLQMLDDQDNLITERANESELPGMGDVAENGKQYAYGKKTKSLHRHTPDGEHARQMRIHFDADDVPSLPELEDSVSADDVIDAVGCKPFGVEP